MLARKGGKDKMTDKFKKGDLVCFDIGVRTFRGFIVKTWHSRKGTTRHEVMTDWQVVKDEDCYLPEDKI